MNGFVLASCQFQTACSADPRFAQTAPPSPPSRDTKQGNPMRLQDKVAVITGAASGIGEGAATSQGKNHGTAPKLQQLAPRPHSLSTRREQKYWQKCRVGIGRPRSHGVRLRKTWYNMAETIAAPKPRPKQGHAKMRRLPEGPKRTCSVARVKTASPEVRPRTDPYTDWPALHQTTQEYACRMTEAWRHLPCEQRGGPELEKTDIQNVRNDMHPPIVDQTAGDRMASVSGVGNSNR